MSKPGPLSWTLRFKKYKTTVLLMLPAQESIHATKEKLHSALKSRNIHEINGDPVPENPADIQFGVPIDRNELEKGWIRLSLELAEGSDSSTTATTSTIKSKSSNGKKKPLADSLQATDIRNGQAVAFRFKRDAGEGGDDESEFGDPGWDVVIPSLDDDEDFE